MKYDIIVVDFLQLKDWRKAEMNNLFVVESRGQRVLTSAQIAECYSTTVDCIKQNFHANKSRFVEGKHYISLTGNELKDFKNKVRIPYPVKNENENEVRIPHSAEIKAKYQFDTQFKYAKSLYLWTEKGALLHAKSFNTDKAWEVYDYLVDFYFRAKEKVVEPEKKEIVPVEIKEEPIKEESSIQVTGEDEIGVFKALLKIAEKREIKVKTLGLNAAKSYLKGNRIGIRCGMTLKEINYELAYELFHSVVHYDKGNMIDTPLRIYYNSQAERAAAFLLQILQVKTA